jgi:hypothetical protein
LTRSTEADKADIHQDLLHVHQLKAIIGILMRRRRSATGL